MSSPILAARRVITLSDTPAQPWIDIRCEVGCCAATFAQAGFTPHRVVEADGH